MPMAHLIAMETVAVGRLTVSKIVLVATSSTARKQLGHFRRLPEDIRAISDGL
jgi:hypothetical protein